MDNYPEGKAKISRTRASKPKLKTGCRTCRKRRVKCDEAKPFCSRCIKFGGEGYCDGYLAPESRVATKKLVSRNGDRRRLIPIKSRADLQQIPALPQHLYTQSFSNNDEFQSFNLYREEVAPRLSFLPDSVWDHLMLQAGEAQQIIRHGIIAIGAFSKVLNLTGPNIIQVPGDDILPLSFQETPFAKQISSHQAFGLRHYDKFLSGLRSYNAQALSPKNLRMALIGILIIYCAENIQYRQHNALSAALNGNKLVGEFIRSNTLARSHGLVSSPKPSVLEDALVQQFRRMELQVLVMTEYQSVCSEGHLDIKDQDKLAISCMPPLFSTIEDAGLYMELIVRRSYHYVAFLFSERQIMLRFLEDNSQPPEAKGDNYRPILPKGVSVDTLQVEHEMYAAEIRRWQKAYEPLLRKEIRDMNTIDALRAVLIKMQSISYAIRIAGAFSDTELVYDKYNNEFFQIVSLATYILDHSQADKFFGAGAFSCDIGLILHLLTPAMKCRDRRLRRKAISLLLRNPWREATGGSSQSADVAAFLMEVEEEGIETDYIPEMARARLTGIEITHKTRTARLHCIRGVGEHATQHSSLRDWSKLPA